MPLPSPGKSESQKDFTARFMADPEARKTFPDAKQRYAVMMEKWRHRKAKATLVVQAGDDTILYGLPDDPNAFLEIDADIEMEALGSEKEPYGDVHYCDNGMRSDGKKRFPVNTPSRIRAAWSYSHHKAIMAHYTKEQLSRLHACIARAWREKISKDGPPAAE